MLLETALKMLFTRALIQCSLSNVLTKAILVGCKKVAQLLF